MGKFIPSLMTGIQSALNVSGLKGRTDLAQYTISSESFIGENADAARTAIADLNDVVTQTIEDVISSEEFGFEPTDAQLAAAHGVAAIALDPAAARSALRNLNGDTGAQNVIGTLGAHDLGIEDYVDAGTISNEAFDGQTTNSAVYFSIVYNLLAARQDAFGELFYPTITIDPSASGANVEARVISLYNEVTRSTTGSADKGKFNKVSVVKVITDSTLLSADRNRVYPVKRDGSTEDVLVHALSYGMDVNGEIFDTAPIQIGKEVSLLGVSQTNAQIAKGMMDNTDALDRRIQLTDLYFQLTGDVATTSTTEDFKYDMSILPHSNFTYSTQDHHKDLQLALNTTGIVLSTTTTKLVDEGTSAVLGTLPADHTVRIKTVLHGEGNTAYGDIALYASAIEVVEVRDAAGQLVTDPAVLTAFSTIFDTITVVGYSVEAYTTNSNLRSRGQLVGVDVYNQVYTVPVRSGITVEKTITNAQDTDNDATYLASQVTFAGIKTSLHAVESLTNFADTLRTLTLSGANTDIEIMGMGRFFVDAYYKSISLDLETAVDSLRSTDRAADIKSAIINVIKDAAIQMSVASNYSVASKVLNDGMSSKITVIVGTDTRIAQYITTGLEDNPLGDLFDLKIEATSNPRVAGKIYISFGDFGSGRNTTPNCLNFGQMFWSPEVSVDTLRQGSGRIGRELTTMPRFLHVTNLPVLTEITVTKIENVLGKVTQNYSL